MIRHAFGLLEIRELFARHHPDNRGSGRILEKLGFCYPYEERRPQTGLDHPCYLLRARQREKHAGSKGEASDRGKSLALLDGSGGGARG